MPMLPSATEPDWSREAPKEFWQPSHRLLWSVRRYREAQTHPGLWARLMLRRWVLSHRFWSIVTGADIPLNCRIGGGLLMPHPNGIVIHPDAVIGPNCLLFQQVTLGTARGFGAPRLGGHVDVGAGAKILGGIVIGDHAIIGANSVVLSDIPAGATAVGSPARVVKVREGLG